MKKQTKNKVVYTPMTEEQSIEHNFDPKENNFFATVVECKHQNQGDGKCFDCGQPM